MLLHKAAVIGVIFCCIFSFHILQALSEGAEIKQKLHSSLLLPANEYWISFRMALGAAFLPIYLHNYLYPINLDYLVPLTKKQNEKTTQLYVATTIFHCGDGALRLIWCVTPHICIVPYITFDKLLMRFQFYRSFLLATLKSSDCLIAHHIVLLLTEFPS